MSFYMPTVDFSSLIGKQRATMSNLVEQGRLVTMPKWNCNDFTKLVHHFLLKYLYRDLRWTVPRHHAWYMPHLVSKPDNLTIKNSDIEARDIYDSGCFGDPQPVHVGDKQYLVTRKDNSTFIMEVS